MNYKLDDYNHLTASFCFGGGPHGLKTDRIYYDATLNISRMKSELPLSDIYTFVKELEDEMIELIRRKLDEVESR